MSLVDSHVHLDRYPDEDVTGMVSRASAAGVDRLLTIGTDLSSSRAAIALAGRHVAVLAAVGIHPSRLAAIEGRPENALTPQPPLPTVGEGETNTCSPRPRTGRGAGGEGILSAERQLADLLEELDRDPSAIRPAAIGEVGLDEHAPDLAGQQRFLAACLELSEQRGLPLVLHVVGAPAVHVAALAIVARRPGVRTVAHYFVGGPALARQYVEAGCWISVGRPVTRPSETALREAVPVIPMSRLLLETDTYPLPGRATEPRDVTTVCAAVAALTGRTFAEVAAVTTANFAAFIGR